VLTAREQRRALTTLDKPTLSAGLRASASALEASKVVIECACAVVSMMTGTLSVLSVLSMSRWSRRVRVGEIKGVCLRGKYGQTSATTSRGMNDDAGKIADPRSCFPS